MLLKRYYWICNR